MADTSPIAGYPQVGSTHKNGDRMFGNAGPYARTLAARGTPKLSSLYHSTVTDRIRSVRVHDTLRVEWDGMKHWWASDATGVVGRLSWSKGYRDHVANLPADAQNPYDFDNGTLHVQTVTVNRAGQVVDCSGYVIPDGHDPADWPDAHDPSPRERTVVIKVPAPASPEASTKPRRTLLDRLLGR